MVSEKSDPIICRIMDYKGRMYDLFKKRMQETDFGERLTSGGIRNLSV